MISWIGLWELAPGPNPFGADPALAIALPAAQSPSVAGTIRLADGAAVLEPEPGSGLRIDGVEATEPTALENDRSDRPTVWTLGSLGMRIHAERGTSRLWLRAWDRDLERLASFALPPHFPVDREWMVPARFDAHRSPRTVRLGDVQGGTVEHRSPGDLVFEVGGREFRLAAFAEESSSSHFVSLWDSTAVESTYQGGRYLRVPFADEDGRTVVDFNRAYNPPCVFTPHSVCSLPPRQNRLPLWVTAGERRPVDPPRRPG